MDLNVAGKSAINHCKNHDKACENPSRLQTGYRFKTEQELSDHQLSTQFNDNNSPKFSIFSSLYFEAIALGEILRKMALPPKRLGVSLQTIVARTCEAGSRAQDTGV
jgi:hypothetical protein